MRIILIITNAHRRNIVFISDSLKALSLQETIREVSSGMVEDLFVVRGKHGTYVRSLPNTSKKDNLDAHSVSVADIIEHAQSIQHTHSTSTIGAYAGTIFESGDSGCHFYVGEIRTTSLPRDTIERIYKPTGVSLFGFAQRLPAHVVFMEDVPSLLIDKPVEEWMIEYLDKRGATAPTAYVVYVAQHTHSSFGDYRCLD